MHRKALINKDNQPEKDAESRADDALNFGNESGQRRRSTPNRSQHARRFSTIQIFGLTGTRCREML
jgi:hypothetical protein